ncbi:glycosyltransferase family 4 protein [Nocardia vinacea]|uniref:glycosyltransferase family 4 protein n=1 Tax=Nocardia vinacea TaxID=96468 RepID=UPI0033D53C05
MKYFTALGVQTTLHHPATVDRSKPFELMPGVSVVPVAPMLLEKPSGSLWADPISHASAIAQIRRTIERSDIFYVHGANLPYIDISDECSIIHSVHDFVYHEAVTGVLNFTRDRLVAVSDYTGSCIREVFRRIRRVPGNSLQVVPNGFYSKHFTPVIADALRARIGVSKEDLCLLYPHRSDPDKGITAAIDVVHTLKSLLSQDQYSRLRLLIPAWEAPRFGTEAPRHLTLPPDVEHYAKELGVIDKLHTHPWISASDMPSYYSIGVATLCVGTVPEAFGNVHIESLLSGTPVVIARVGAQRTSIPDDLVRKIDPGRGDQAANHIAEIIGEHERVSKELRELLIERYSLTAMVRGYEQAILNCDPQPSATFSAAPAVELSSTIRIPPWAASLESGYYHDYTGYCTDNRFLRFVPEINSSVTVGELVRDGRIEMSDVHHWIDSGLITTE